jgi:hypothetical protein
MATFSLAHALWSRNATHGVMTSLGMQMIVAVFFSLAVQFVRGQKCLFKLVRFGSSFR